MILRQTSENEQGRPADSTSSGGESALSALRTATQALHEELDRRLPLSQPDVTLDDYVDHLRHLRHWLCELMKTSAGPREERKRILLARIDADLADAGVDTETETETETDRLAPGNELVATAPTNALVRAEAAYRWGVDYVVEGSQLGGKVLYRRLVARLAPNPLSYLKGDAADTGPMWRSFLGALQQAVSSPRDIELACEGAVDAFSALMMPFGLADSLPPAQVERAP